MNTKKRLLIIITIFFIGLVIIGSTMLFGHGLVIPLRMLYLMHHGN